MCGTCPDGYFYGFTPRIWKAAETSSELPTAMLSNPPKNTDMIDQRRTAPPSELLRLLHSGS